MIDFHSIIHRYDNLSISHAHLHKLNFKFHYKLNGTHQLLAYTYDVSLLGDDIDSIKKSTEDVMMLVRKLMLQ
jgi:hypothetical protein